MIDEFYREHKKSMSRGKITIGALIILLIAAAVIASNIYMEIIQLNEIGGFSKIYITNLTYKIVSVIASFVLIFAAVTVTNAFIKRNMYCYISENSLPQKKLPNLLLSSVVAIMGAALSRDFFYQKALNFFNKSSFGKTDPIFGKDVGYYVFQRPFLMSLYEFVSALWVFIIAYTIVYYLVVFFLVNNNVTVQNLKIKSVLRHNLINIALFFLIKAASYKFKIEGILYSSFQDVKGAGYVDTHIWLQYFRVAPFLLILIVIVSFMFIWKSRLRKAAYTIAVYPAVWLIVAVTAMVMQSFIVNPNLLNYEREYLSYNMQKTREAYSMDKVKNIQFPETQALTPDIINANSETVSNIRIVDYQATLDTNSQLQSNTNFYSFHNGDIINYTINGKEIPIFISAREIDTTKIPNKTYINTTFSYTHGYGIAINPINKLTPEGQADYILKDLRMTSADKSLTVKEPRIYYGEMTTNHVIVNASTLDEIDYDGSTKTRYTGQGGINITPLNRLLFSLKYADYNMLVSGYVKSDSKLLLNREIVSRAQKAVPFLTVDSDPCIILGSDGRLKWVLDAYTTTGYYPYSQSADNYGGFNYIRNSVKIVIDAYDGKVKCYIIDKNDPIIQTYSKIYPGIFSSDSLPADVLQHTRYPEALFKVQTEIIKRYHLDPNADPQNIDKFYNNSDLWDVAKYPQHGYDASSAVTDTSDLEEIEPYYNMIKLPQNVGKKEELILMRPFTPSGGKHNMVSWLAVRNSSDNYGDLILFTFPKNTNILGPYQVESNINSIDKVSKDITLWSQSGSRVFKGNLLVIPIEQSVLYVEPIYIKSSGPSAIPQVREIIAGYQSGDEFKYGIGTDLNDALSQLFAGIKTGPAPAVQTPAQTQQANQKLINDILSKYNEMKKQIDDMGKLIDQLKGQGQ